MTAQIATSAADGCDKRVQSCAALRRRVIRPELGTTFAGRVAEHDVGGEELARLEGSHAGTV